MAHWSLADIDEGQFMCSAVQQIAERIVMMVEESARDPEMICILIRHALKALGPNLIDPSIWIGHQDG